MPKRTIVKLAVTSHVIKVDVGQGPSPTDYWQDTVYALADDGTLWRGAYDMRFSGWEPVPALPRSADGMRTHGDSLQCPKVQSGEWSRCQGHPLTEEE